MACAVTPRNTPRQLKQEDKAIVLGVNGNFIKQLLFPTYTEIDFLEIDGEPFDGSWQRVYLLVYHAGKGRCDLRSDGEVPAATVGEIKELFDDLVAGFDLVHL